MTTRDATLSDAEAIARAQVASWHGVYQGLIPDSIIQALTVEKRLEQWHRFLTDPPEGASVLVAESGSDLVGFSAVGPNRDPDLAPETTGEITAIYVHPAHWGGGHGRDLMVGSLGLLRRAQFVMATLWVLDTNARGRSFYERGGWSADGAVKDDTSFGEPLHHVRYRISLSGTPR